MTAVPEATPSPLDIPGHFASLPEIEHMAWGWQGMGSVLGICVLMQQE